MKNRNILYLNRKKILSSIILFIALFYIVYYFMSEIQNITYLDFIINNIFITIIFILISISLAFTFISTFEKITITEDSVMLMVRGNYQNFNFKDYYFTFEGCVYVRINNKLHKTSYNVKIVCHKNSQTENIELVCFKSEYTRLAKEINTIQRYTYKENITFISLDTSPVKFKNHEIVLSKIIVNELFLKVNDRLFKTNEIVNIKMTSGSYIEDRTMRCVLFINLGNKIANYSFTVSRDNNESFLELQKVLFSIFGKDCRFEPLYFTNTILNN